MRWTTPRLDLAVLVSSARRCEARVHPRIGLGLGQIGGAVAKMQLLESEITTWTGERLEASNYHGGAVDWLWPTVHDLRGLERGSAWVAWRWCRIQIVEVVPFKTSEAEARAWVEAGVGFHNTTLRRFFPECRCVS